MNKHTESSTITANYQENTRGLLNADLEELILAYVFFYIKPEYFEPVLEIVHENHFFFRENKIVFLALKEALKQDMPLHPKTVRYLLKPADFARLADTESPQNNGLEKYFTKLMSNVELGVFHLDIEKLCLKLVDLSRRRSLDEICKEGQRRIADPKQSTNDVNAYITSSLVTISKMQFLDKKSAKLEIVLKDVYANLKSAHESESKGIRDGQGVPTGFRALDRILVGFRNSDLILIGARTSMGKTSLVLSIALSVAKTLRQRRLRNLLTENSKTQSKENAKGNILFFSLEMSSSQIGERIIALETEVNLSKMISGNLRNEEFKKVADCLEKMDDMKDLNIAVEELSSPKIIDIRRIANKLAMSEGISLIIVDYLQQIKSDKFNTMEQITEIGAGLKSLAKDLNVPVIALSQLSRNPEGREDKVPRLTDLRASGTLEQDADIVLLLYRKEYYMNQNKPKDPDDPTSTWYMEKEACKDKADIVIAKHRNGAIGDVKMGFKKESMKFHDLDGESNGYNTHNIQKKEFFEKNVKGDG